MNRLSASTLKQTASNGKENRVILNLGCGTKTSAACVNIDWSLAVRLVSNPILRACASQFLNAQQMEKVQRLDKVVPHNLEKGIPYPDNSADVIYHSHVLEHIDRHSVPKFLLEIKRVLKPGGIHRVVVPDLERLAQKYFEDFHRSSNTDWHAHDLKVNQMIEQLVRRESAAFRKHGPARRRIETAVFGDARRRGETHQWMYDRINLAGLLAEAGFSQIAQVDYRTSVIPNWSFTRLDWDDDGIGEYKPESIYFECMK